MKKKTQYFREGFTIIELIVAVAILLLLLTSIGVVFRSASRSVGTSQALMEMLSSTQATQQQIESDVNGINKNGFLVIRCGTFSDGTSNRRCDQISFLARGNFKHRGGIESSATAQFSDFLSTPNALVWWGQLAVSSGNLAISPLDPKTPVNANQQYQVPLNQVPTGATEADFILGRSAILLVPENGNGDTEMTLPTRFVAAYRNLAATGPGLLPPPAIDWNASNVQGNTGEATNASITESRVDAAAVMPGQISAFLQQTIGTNRTASPRYEADHYCYRRAALRSPYDAELAVGASAQLINGYYRTQSVALQGVSSLSIDWTDGSVYAGGEIDVVTGQPSAGSLVGTTRWYGMYQDPVVAHGTASTGLGSNGTYSVRMIDYGVGTAPASSASDTVSNGDHYTAIFSVDNRTHWPVALRFRYHVADVSGRLPNGRDIVQIVKLPS